jgi:signal transduction histidine kinase
MTGAPPVTQKGGEPTGFIRQLLGLKATSGFRSKHFWIIAGLFIIFAFSYYGVLADYQDVYVIIFFYPLVYAAIVFRLRGVFVSSVVVLGILLAQALLFAPPPLSLLRTLFFALFAFLVSGLGATLLNFLEYQAEAYRKILSLNAEMNSYIEQLQKAQQQLIQAAKLSSIGELSASFAHELNNPLAGVLVYTKLMKDKLARESFDKEQIRKSLDKIEQAVEYCSDIIRGLLDFARQSPPRFGPVTLGRAIDKALSLVGPQVKMKRIEVAREEPPGLPVVTADFNQVVQVLINLVVNAVDAMNEGGRLTIRAYGDDGWVRIAVQDTGSGITPENMKKLFTPFFTTKGEVKGVGLGLAVSYGIVERHGGRIEVESEVGRGSTFTVILPAGREEGGYISSQGRT